MGCIRNRFDYAMSVIRHNAELYIIGGVLLISGLLCALFTRSWVVAICVAVAYLIYSLCVDLHILKKMGYFENRKISINIDDSDFEDECGSVYEEEEEKWEDEEDLYIHDDDVEEEYEDENYNEDADEFDFEEVPEEEIEKKRAHEASNGFSDLNEEPYGISCSGYRFTAEELKEFAREIGR